MSKLQVVSVECATRGTMERAHAWIGCEGECQNWYHFSCVGLSTWQMWATKGRLI